MKCVLRYECLQIVDSMIGNLHLFEVDRPSIGQRSQETMFHLDSPVALVADPISTEHGDLGKKADRRKCIGVAIIIDRDLVRHIDPVMVDRHRCNNADLINVPLVLGNSRDLVVLAAPRPCNAATSSGVRNSRHAARRPDHSTDHSIDRRGMAIAIHRADRQASKFFDRVRFQLVHEDERDFVFVSWAM